MASWIKAYNTALIRRPLITQCATASFLFCAGDIVAQQAFEKKGRSHDHWRTARLTFYGGAIFAPIMTAWYRWLSNLKFSSPSRALLTRVCLDQAVLSPVAVGFFFSTMTFLEGEGIDEAYKRVNAAYVPTLLRSWGVYLPTQLVNFAIVPAHLRFVVVGVVSLFWSGFLLPFKFSLVFTVGKTMQILTDSYLSFANAKQVVMNFTEDKEL